MYGMLIAGLPSASRTKSWDQGKSGIPRLVASDLFSVGFEGTLGHVRRHVLSPQSHTPPGWNTSRSHSFLLTLTLARSCGLRTEPLIKLHLSKMSFEQSFQLQVRGDAVQGEKRQLLI